MMLGLIYIVGVVLGFVLLASALWRARAVPRWAAACIGLGPVIHVAGGDLPWTAAGGGVVLAVGLGGLALTQLGRLAGPATAAGVRAADPAELVVSPGDPAR